MRVWLTRTTHISWHFAWLAGGYICGLGILPALQPIFSGVFWPVSAASLTLVAFSFRTVLLTIFSLVAGVCFGLWRGSLELTALQLWRPHVGELSVISGSVFDDVARNKTGDHQMTLTNVRLDNQPMRGKVWVSTTAKAPILRSQIVTFNGKIKDGFGNTAASISRADLVNIRDPPIPDYARLVRDWFATGIRRAIPDPQAALGSGYLVGQKSTLPTTLNDQLKAVGLTHAVVASGYNLTILVSFARSSLLRCSKYLATLVSTLMIGSFMLITGFSPSMLRAGLVTTMSLAAWYFGRAIHPFVLLPVSAAITLLLDPSYIWGDLGWYLSFGSFAGLVMVSPLITRYFWPDDASESTVRGIFLETTSAQLATMPIMLHSFGQFSAYAIVANMLVLPFVPLTMVLTFFAGIAGLALPSIAHVAGLPASAVLNYMIWIIGWVAGWPGALSKLTFGTDELWLSYAALAMTLHFMWRRTGHSFKTST